MTLFVIRNKRLHHSSNLFCTSSLPTSVFQTPFSHLSPLPLALPPSHPLSIGMVVSRLLIPTELEFYKTPGSSDTSQHNFLHLSQRPRNSICYVKEEVVSQLLVREKCECDEITWQMCLQFYSSFRHKFCLRQECPPDVVFAMCTHVSLISLRASRVLQLLVLMAHQALAPEQCTPEQCTAEHCTPEQCTPEQSILEQCTPVKTS